MICHMYALKLSSCPLNPNFFPVFRIILTRACLEQNIEMTEKGNPAGSGDSDGQGVTKWTNIRKNTDFWFLKIPSGYVEVFKKKKKALFIIFWRLFACILVLVCTLTKKIHGNFHVPLCMLSA